MDAYTPQSKAKKNQLKHKQQGDRVKMVTGTAKPETARNTVTCNYNMDDLTAQVCTLLLECSCGEKELAAKLMEDLMEEATLAARVENIADGILYSQLITDLVVCVKHTDKDRAPEKQEDACEYKLLCFLQMAGNASHDDQNMILKTFYRMLHT